MYFSFAKTVSSRTTLKSYALGFQNGLSPSPVAQASSGCVPSDRLLLQTSRSAFLPSRPDAPFRSCRMDDMGIGSSRPSAVGLRQHEHVDVLRHDDVAEPPDRVFSAYEFHRLDERLLDAVVTKEL